MSAGPDHPDHSMLLKGPRGSGKTVLLAAMRDMAEQNGLMTVRVTAKPEPTFADALIEQMTSASDADGPPPVVGAGQRPRQRRGSFLPKP